MLQTRLQLCIILVSLGCLSTITVEAQDELSCVGSGNVTVDGNGNLVFPPLPEGGTDFTYEYDPAIGGWYDLANGFVDMVRPGGLPYGEFIVVLLAWLFVFYATPSNTYTCC